MRPFVLALIANIGAAIFLLSVGGYFWAGMAVGTAVISAIGVAMDRGWLR